MSDYEDGMKTTYFKESSNLEFEYESDAEAYDDQRCHEDSRIENLFYDAEDYKTSNPVKALAMFREVASTPSSWYVV